jgi:peptidoglycan/xylan/chitin deacetylase (PgdA/CDA1 family)
MLVAGMSNLSVLLYLALGGLRPFAEALPVTPLKGEPVLITRGAPTGTAVAITFDACATKTQGYGFDRPIFEVLERERVPATIFVSGRWVESHPDVMSELVANPLIEFGDHSYDHPHMTRLTPEQMGREIDQTEAALGRFGKRSVAFRPPFGDVSRGLLQVVHDKQLPAVSWDVVSGDPAASTTAAGMIRTVVHGTRPGSIIIFHINGRAPKTAEALPEILRELRARGFTFVHLSELLAGAALPLPAALPPVEPPPFVVTPAVTATAGPPADR